MRLTVESIDYVPNILEDDALSSMADAIEAFLLLADPPNEARKVVRILFPCGRVKGHQHPTPEIARLCRKGQEPVT